MCGACGASPSARSADVSPDIPPSTSSCRQEAALGPGGDYGPTTPTPSSCWPAPAPGAGRASSAPCLSERQRCAGPVAVGDPGLVLLDEPTAGPTSAAAGPRRPPGRLAWTPPRRRPCVTHHVEEIPPGFTHAAAADGRAMAAGPLAEVLPPRSAPVRRALVSTGDGRWAARRRRPHGRIRPTRASRRGRERSSVAEQPLDQRADQVATVVEVHLQRCRCRPARPRRSAPTAWRRPSARLLSDAPRLVDRAHHAAA